MRLWGNRQSANTTILLDLKQLMNHTWIDYRMSVINSTIVITLTLNTKASPIKCLMYITGKKREELSKDDIFGGKLNFSYFWKSFEMCYWDEDFGGTQAGNRKTCIDPDPHNTFWGLVYKYCIRSCKFVVQGCS